MTTLLYWLLGVAVFALLYWLTLWAERSEHRQ